MLSLEKNLCGEHFDEYVAVCAAFADTFSLTENGWDFADKEAEKERILTLFAPYLIRTGRINRWFASYTPAGYEKEVMLFRMTEESKRLLLSEYRSIFYDGTVWKKPEDLCYFRDGKLISGSVTHEQICFVYDHEDEFSAKITLNGAWKTVKTRTEEQINLTEMRLL